jgi:Tfp pilus assembly protein PilF
MRCCDAPDTALPGQDALALLEPQAAEAIKFFNAKQYPEAEAQALKLLDLAPNLRQALRVIFEIRKAENKAKTAEILARRLAGLPGANNVVAAANIQLAQLVIGQGRYADALESAGRAVVATPRDPTAHHVMGVVLTETGKLAGGERHYRRATALLGREDGLVLANLAWNLKLQGRLEEAATLYSQALMLRADNKRAVGGFAQTVFARGARAQALSIIDEGLSRWPDERTLRLLRALADLAAGDAAAVLARLSDAPENLLPAELCVRGQALAREGKAVEAVMHYATAKRIQRERNGMSYKPEPFQARFDTYKAYFQSDRTQPLPRAAVATGPQPIFILGFPRSGTSLLEQLLAQIPGIVPGDEAAPIADLTDAVAAMTGKAYPEGLDQLLIGDGFGLPDRLRTDYEAPRAALGLHKRGVNFVTDRSGSNVWHLGLIKLLYPDAPILHLLRHPYDVALSNLSQDRRMEAGAETSLVAAAKHYALHMEMLKFYRGQLTLRYHALRYEDLVQTPQAAMRAVLDFLGLATAVPPAEKLLANDARIPIPTPSHYAVREAIHERGLYRHLGYRESAPNLFSEVAPILKPWIESLGYGDAP